MSLALHLTQKSELESNQPELNNINVGDNQSMVIAHLTFHFKNICQKINHSLRTVENINIYYRNINELNMPFLGIVLALPIVRIHTTGVES